MAASVHRLARDLDASIHVEPHGGGDTATRATRVAAHVLALAAGAPDRAVPSSATARRLVARRAATTLRCRSSVSLRSPAASRSPTSRTRAIRWSTDRRRQHLFAARRRASTRRAGVSRRRVHTSRCAITGTSAFSTVTARTRLVARAWRIWPRTPLPVSTHAVRVGAGDPTRLDAVVRALLPRSPSSGAHVDRRGNHSPERPLHPQGRPRRHGDLVEIRCSRSPAGPDVPLRVLYDDDDVVAVDKPGGVSGHALDPRDEARSPGPCSRANPGVGCDR